jgi:hypothetical protein
LTLPDLKCKRRGPQIRAFLLFDPDLTSLAEISGAELFRQAPMGVSSIDQTIPNTIAARKPNDRTMPSTFSRIASCIVASQFGQRALVARMQGRLSRKV